MNKFGKRFPVQLRLHQRRITDDQNRPSIFASASRQILSSTRVGLQLRL